MSDLPTKTYPPSFLQAMIADHEAEQAGATTEESSVVRQKGDAMSEQAHDTTETESDPTVSDQQGVLMRISRHGLWVNPDIPADECAQHMLASLRPLLSHTINTEVNIQVARLAAERDAAQAEVERLRAKLHELDHKLETAQIKLMTWHEGTSLDPAAQLRADVARLISERDAAQAEVNRLTAERDQARADVDRLVFALQMAESSDREGNLIDSIPANDPDWIFSNTEMMSGPEEAWREENHRLRRERNDARAEVERLRANGQAILDSSRPTDETIWREAFMSAVHDVHKNWMDVADVALAQYRKRWPR